MVSLQGLHMSDAFRCPHILASVGLKSFFPWWGNTKMIAIHLRKVHYRMAIVCDICQPFTDMNAQSILDHCSGCKAMGYKKCLEQTDRKRQKSCTRRSPSLGNGRRHPNYPAQRSPRSHKEWNATQHLLSSPARECKSIHFLKLSGSSLIHFLVSPSSVR